MPRSLLPVQRRVLNWSFVVGTIGMLVRYLLVDERVPNYQRVLGWLADWWR